MKKKVIEENVPNLLNDIHKNLQQASYSMVR